jgi:hypothetical protein
MRNDVLDDRHLEWSFTVFMSDYLLGVLSIAVNVRYKMVAYQLRPLASAVDAE